MYYIVHGLSLMMINQRTWPCYGAPYRLNYIYLHHLQIIGRFSPPPPTSREQGLLTFIYTFWSGSDPVLVLTVECCGVPDGHVSPLTSVDGVESSMAAHHHPLSGRTGVDNGRGRHRRVFLHTTVVSVRQQLLVSSRPRVIFPVFTRMCVQSFDFAATYFAPLYAATFTLEKGIRL